MVFERAPLAPHRSHSPSRASVPARLLPHTHGVIHDDVPLQGGIPTLADELRPTGYGLQLSSADGTSGRTFEGPRSAGGSAGLLGQHQGHAAPHNHAAAGSSDYHRFLVSQVISPPECGTDQQVFGGTPTRLPETVDELGLPGGGGLASWRPTAPGPSSSPELPGAAFPFFGPLDDEYEPATIDLRHMALDRTSRSPDYRLLFQASASARTRTSAPTTAQAGGLLARYGPARAVDRHTSASCSAWSGWAWRTTPSSSTPTTAREPDRSGTASSASASSCRGDRTQIPFAAQGPGGGARAHGRASPPVRRHADAARPPRAHRPRAGSEAPRCVRSSREATSLRTDAGAAADGGGWDVSPDEAEVVVEWNGWNLFPAQQRQTYLGADPAQLAQPRSPVDARTIRRGRWKLSAYVTGEAELYDLRADPSEARNLARRAEHRATVAALYERLLAWQRVTRDTLALPDPATPSVWPGAAMSWPGRPALTRPARGPSSAPPRACSNPCVTVWYTVTPTLAGRCTMWKNLP